MVKTAGGSGAPYSQVLLAICRTPEPPRTGIKARTQTFPSLLSAPAFFARRGLLFHQPHNIRVCRTIDGKINRCSIKRIDDRSQKSAKKGRRRVRTSENGESARLQIH